jgi:choline dehydrogenase-like flavoprotein
MAIALTDRQRAALTALCDTFVPAVERVPDPDGFWARSASDLGVPLALEALLQARVPNDQAAGLGMLLDGLDQMGIVDASQAAREELVRTVSATVPEVAAGIDALRGGALMLAYGLPGPEGINPFWVRGNYPGPTPPPDALRAIRPLVPDDGEVLWADVVVVGSGAGGGVVAGELAMAGLDVVVLESGGYFDQADFNQYELWAYENLYLRGGPFLTADGNVTLLAGHALGGGTTVNWSNSVRPPARVRRQWEAEHGLAGLGGAEFDRHLDAVLARIKANDECSDYNGPHQRLAEGAAKLGYDLRRAMLNIDPDRYDPERAGHTGWGDQTGAKQGTLETWLQDAHDQGARIVVRCHAERVVAEDGRATGLVARRVDQDGSDATLTVRAPVVVAACGALETPALLLRSGIGGPAAGDHLHLHPVAAVSGIYDSEQRGWWGPAQAAILHDFADLHDGYGVVIEATHYTTGLAAAATPWRSGSDHKTIVSKGARAAPLIAIARDRGHGRVTVDQAGEPVVSYPLDDDLDRRHLDRGIAELARIHEAAGAEEIIGLTPEVPVWRRGDDLDAWIERLTAVPLGAGGQALFSAHQMGSARMGTDPSTSVAGPYGELHDVKGVWIGDTSAFPTALGVNPMVTCMALARRTALAILNAGA